ncbi:hypothetical protein WA026_011132 [Henosepilachna vigintioctopunctata]|uniref:Uncharacterized protein n=1 Tax=Henosepilachna vigintioctopunctata TaxID=420089 RepID=A0AAW1U4Y3_9CUCU
MALRICSTLNKGAPGSCMRLLSNNVPQMAVYKVPEESMPTSQKEKECSETTWGRNDECQLKVVRPLIASNQRTTPSDNPRSWSNAFETEQETEKRGIENKFLQPATMPKYCETPIFDHKFMQSIQEPQIKKAREITLNNSASQNILEVLKKKKNQNSYIKFIKMASSPFPDPIKAIFSPYTISDEEKARQMLDDHKMARMMSTQVEKGTFSSGLKDNIMKVSKQFHSSVPISAKMSSNSDGFCSRDQPQKRFYGASFSNNHKENLGEFRFGYQISKSATQQRLYSDKKCEKSEVCVDKQKCPKEKSCVAKKCDKIKIKGCPAVRGDGICKERIQEVKCTKIEAPYPSFSEKCYLEPKPRLSECEICPWSRKKNPNFKSKIKLPNRKFHTARASNITGSNLARNLEVLSADCSMCNSHAWTQKANLSQMHKSGRNTPKTDFYDIGKLGQIVSNLFKGNGCDKVDKDPTKCKKISPGPCKGAKLRKPMDYLKEHFEKSKVKEEKNESTSKCQSREVANDIQIFGYCLRRPTVMTEFLTQNSELMTNFRNGDDLGDFGVNKMKLSQILCSPGKGTEYPENCEKTYIDNTKKCPTGLTYKKTNKDRLKRKKPKETDPICEKK